MEENIALLILNKVDIIANQVSEIQVQINGMQNQMNGMQDQIDGMQNQINGMESRIDGLEEKMDKMNDNFMNEISEIKIKLDEVANDTSFSKNACLSILEYLEKEEKFTDEISQTTKNHERRISILEKRKSKIIPLV